MKVFISWSGESSKKLAAVLHDWLPSVIQSVKPYMSAENIDKGERWSIDIATQLQETNYGLVCITPDNINAPWINFESGALSKSIQQSRVSPIIFGLEPSDLAKSPLLQFQLTQFKKEEISKILLSMNNAAPEPERVNSDVLEKSFNRAWNELETSVSAVVLERPQSNSESNKVLKDDTATDSIKDAIQETLTISRSQLRILNSPSEILPLEYMENILRRLRVNSPIEAGHPVWRDINRGLDGIAILQSLINEQKIKFEPEISSGDRLEIVRAASKIRHAITYLKRKLYHDDNFVPRNDTRQGNEEDRDNA